MSLVTKKQEEEASSSPPVAVKDKQRKSNAGIEETKCTQISNGRLHNPYQTQIF